LSGKTLSRPGSVVWHDAFDRWGHQRRRNLIIGYNRNTRQCSLPRLLARWAKTDVLILDDWASRRSGPKRARTSWRSSKIATASARP